MCKKIFTSYFYEGKTRLMLLFTLVLHIFDIVSDIIVTVDLKNENSEYFYTSFGILLFSFISSALLSLNDHDFRTYAAYENKFIIKYNNENDCVLFKVTFKLFLKACKWMIMDILQFKYIKNSLLFILTNDLTIFDIQELTDKRIKEALLESGPEALFQLFIILNQSNNKTFLELITYYLSVKLSLLSLTNTLISNEVNSLKIINYMGIQMERPFKYLDNISYTSTYIKNIIVFRLTEVFSRIGLLSCISQVYNGYYLFSFIFLDYVVMKILNIIKRILRFKIEGCEFSEAALEAMKNSKYVSEYMNSKKILKRNQNRNSIKYNSDISTIEYNAYRIQLAWRLHKHHSIKKIFKNMNTLKQWKETYIKWVDYEKDTNENLQKEKDKLLHNKFGNEFHGIKYLLNNIKQLGVYSNPLSIRLIKQIKREKTEYFLNSAGIYFKSPSDHFWWNQISMNILSKYLNHLIISILLVYKLTIEEQSTTIIVITMSSICCFVINMFSLYKITTLITHYINKCDKNIFASNINFKYIYNCKCLDDNKNTNDNVDNKT